MNQQLNIPRIKAVYNLLGDLKDEVVFVGGATVSLYADRQTPEVRPTDDVDILVKIASRSHFINLEERLRKLGFKNSPGSNFIGR